MIKALSKNILSKVIFGIIILCLGIFFANSQNAFAADKYSVTFRTGAQGSFKDGSNKYVMQVEYGECLNTINNKIPEVIMNNGSVYYFKGWNKEIPETVTGRLEFVAQYGMLIDSVKYTVKYVDNDGKDLETSFTSYANKGDIITVYPSVIEGYKADAAEKKIEITNEQALIKFIYAKDSEVSDNKEVTINEVSKTTQNDTNKVNALYSKSGDISYSDNNETDTKLPLIIVIVAAVVTFVTCVILYKVKENKLKKSVSKL